MRHSHSVLAFGALVAGAVAFSGPATAATGADYYNGKTVTWIVATSPGGGHDYFARLMSRHMEKALPGSTFVVKNRPGAGHILGANLIWNAKPNGLTIGSFSTGLIYAQIQKTKGIRFDLAKMSWIGKGASDIRVMSVAHNSEYQSFKDVLNSKRKVKFSASGVGGGSYADAFMMGETFKINYRIIVGYSGPDLRPAALILSGAFRRLRTASLGRSEGFAHHEGIGVGARADARGRELHLALGVQHVLEALVFGIMGDRHDADIGCALADPRHLGEIEPDTLCLLDLGIDQAGREAADGQPIGRRVPEQVGAEDMTGAGPVLDHEGRARQRLFHVTRHQAGEIVMAAAGRGRDDPSHRLAVVIIGAGRGSGGSGKRHRAGDERAKSQYRVGMSHRL